jgi:hypothetical protein
MFLDNFLTSVQSKVVVFACKVQVQDYVIPFFFISVCQALQACDDEATLITQYFGKGVTVTSCLEALCRFLVSSDPCISRVGYTWDIRRTLTRHFVLLHVLQRSSIFHIYWPLLPTQTSITPILINLLR